MQEHIQGDYLRTPENHLSQAPQSSYLQKLCFTLTASPGTTSKYTYSLAGTRFEPTTLSLHPHVACTCLLSRDLEQVYI